MPITALYAGLLAPLYIALSVLVIRQRRSARVPLGDGGQTALLRRMRVHANFAEYVPLSLILMGLAESLKTSITLLHALGIALLAARLLHAYGVSRPEEDLRFRVGAMVTSFTVLGVGAAACVVGALR